MEDTIYVTPTIIMRRDEDTEAVASVPGEEKALLVFRNEEDAERFRATTGQYPEEEGYEAIYVELVDLAKICIRHDLRHVCMPEAWTGTKESGADTFKTHAFIQMLMDSVEE